MLRKRCRILSQFKTPLPLNMATSIKFIFDYEDGRKLETTKVEVIDQEAGIVEFMLTDFEINGLKAGPKQDFYCEVYFPKHKEVVLFSKCMDIVETNGKKAWSNGV